MSWASQYDASKALIEEITSLITERNTLLNNAHASMSSGSSNDASAAPRLAASARRKLATLASKLDILDRTAATGPEVMEREIARRTELVAMLRTRREQLTGMLARNPNNAAGGAEADSTTSLLQGVNVSNVTQIRGTETEATAPLDDRGVLRLQQTMMQEQDEDLADLERAVAGTKNVALTINDELDEQNRLLDDLDEDVDAVGGRLRAATRRIGKVSKLSGNCAQYTCMLVLIAVLVVLIVVSLKY